MLLLKVGFFFGWVVFVFVGCWVGLVEGEEMCFDVESGCLVGIWLWEERVVLVVCWRCLNLVCWFVGRWGGEGEDWRKEVV